MDWLRGDHRWIGWLALGLLIIAIVWLWFRGRRKPVPYGSSKPAHTTDAMWWLWQQLYQLEPSSQLGGTFADKPGYHNYRNDLPSYDYSVCDRPPDDGGPGDMCAAIDWTFPNAQRGDYSTIAKYTTRLINSGKDPNDPRMNGWREVYGNADNDTYVEGYDFRYQCDATSDSSHLWHIHLSENRDQVSSYENKEALLSVLRGETVDQWLNQLKGDGAVLLNCPYDESRLDLLYVDSTGAVRHNWWNGGLSVPWSKATPTESLGGVIEVGTLTAAWAPNGEYLQIAGLGKGDAKTPGGCGQFWSMTLGSDGKKSGWGSMESVYGKLPAYEPAVLGQTTTVDNRAIGLAFCAILIAILAFVYAVWG